MSRHNPVIKWSGSKRSQAKQIAEIAPQFKRYYEPFVGGGSVMYAIGPNVGLCGDVCKPLIDLWNKIKNDPSALADSYEELWTELQKDYLTYNRARDAFNKTGAPEELLFLTRTCVNGLIRFNSEGKFNNSLHYTRKGIDPKKLREIILDWSTKIQGVEFIHGDYRETTASANKEDFVYLDPPYFNTKGRYYGKIDFEQFYQYLKELNSRGVKFALSFDGTRGDTIYETTLPKELYKRKLLLPSGKSAFRKVIDGVSEDVFETLYLSW